MYTHIYLKRAARIRCCFSQKEKRSCKQGKHRRGLWSVFSDLCLCIGFYSENFYHLALPGSVSQRLIRHRCQFSDALVRYSRGCEYDTGQVSLERTLRDIPSCSFFGTQLQQRQSQVCFAPSGTLKRYDIWGGLGIDPMKKRLCSSLPTAARAGQKQGWGDRVWMGFRSGIPKGSWIEFGLFREKQGLSVIPSFVKKWKVLRLASRTRGDTAPRAGRGVCDLSSSRWTWTVLSLSA